jgi:hypothetical protein
MRLCEKNGSTPSFCLCTLNWFETNIAFSQFVHDSEKLLLNEQNHTGQPPPDVTEADAMCSTNGS